MIIFQHLYVALNITPLVVARQGSECGRVA